MSHEFSTQRQEGNTIASTYLVCGFVNICSEINHQETLKQVTQLSWIMTYIYYLLSGLWPEELVVEFILLRYYLQLIYHDN